MSEHLLLFGGGGGVFQKTLNPKPHFGGPYRKDYSTLGSISGLNTLPCLQFELGTLINSKGFECA